MASTGWENTDLLTEFNLRAGRPTSDTFTDTQKYTQLSRSQERIIGLMSAVCPQSLYPHVAYASIPTLTTTDNQIYTFGTDGRGYATLPMGKGGIFASLNDIPDSPLVLGQDYMVEGTQIRALNNGTLPATLYWYGIAMPAPITGSAQPSLFPEASRELIVIDAVRQFAVNWKRDAELAALMVAEWSAAWPTWCLVWKTQFKGGGALNVWTGMQMAVAGHYGGY